MQTEIIMQGRLTKLPFFALLIPVFFVMHGSRENFGFISFRDAILLILTYSIATTILFFVFFIFLAKDKIKTALFAAWLMTCFLFFGAIQDFLKEHLKILSKYSVLLPLILVSIIILFIFLKRSGKDHSKIVLYLNSIFLIFVTIDAVSITIKSINPSANKFSIYPFAKANTYKETGNAKKYDIYFLLFDEYASSLSLKQQYNFNNDLDSFLLQKGFHIQQKSYSNYNITFFSMASMLNMSYLNGVHEKMDLKVDDYGNCTKLIRDNEVVKFLSVHGYNIINYSMFDLAGNPSPVNQTILPLKTRLITDNTFFSRINKNVGWMLYSGPLGIESLNINRLLTITRGNDALLDSLTIQTKRTSAQPVFIYAHIFMPHDPFFYDKKGNLKNIRTVISEHTNASKPYLEYLQYTNTKIKALINMIQSNTNNNAVIILMGDHGFRERWDTHESCQNMNAVFLPSNDYHLLYDSISGVNQFRVIFNTLFNQSFTLQKDSTIFLKKAN